MRTSATVRDAPADGTIYFANRTRGTEVDAAAVQRTAHALLAAVGAPGASLSLTLVRDRAIRALNRAHRHTDAPTDVLSFPLHEPSEFDRRAATRPKRRISEELLLGDIVISIDTARRQAEAYGAPLARELERLLIHGILHLCGHDHLEPGERRVMEREERRLASAIGMPWPYPDEADAV